MTRKATLMSAEILNFLDQSSCTSGFISPTDSSPPSSSNESSDEVQENDESPPHDQHHQEEICTTTANEVQHEEEEDKDILKMMETASLDVQRERNYKKPGGHCQVAKDAKPGAQIEVHRLVNELERLQKERKRENSVAFQVYARKKILKIQLRSVEKEQERQQKKLQQLQAQNAALVRRNKQQNLEINLLLSRTQCLVRTEQYLTQVDAEKTLLEEQCMDLETRLKEYEAREKSNKQQSSRLQHQLELALNSAGYHCKENETLRSRIKFLERQVEQFHFLRIEQPNKSSAQPLLKKSHST